MNETYHYISNNVTWNLICQAFWRYYQILCMIREKHPPHKLHQRTSLLVLTLLNGKLHLIILSPEEETENHIEYCYSGATIMVFPVLNLRDSRVCSVFHQVSSSKMLGM